MRQGPSPGGGIIGGGIMGGGIPRPIEPRSDMMRRATDAVIGRSGPGLCLPSRARDKGQPRGFAGSDFRDEGSAVWSLRGEQGLEKAIIDALGISRLTVAPFTSPGLCATATPKPLSRCA